MWNRSHPTPTWVVLAATLGLSSCEPKVPIVDVGAVFSIADASWFEDEQTLFIFYRIDSLQGLSPESQMEIAFTTDDRQQDFAPLESFPPVHTHVPVSCGEHTVCGSWSLRLAQEPRQLRMQLRYHRDSQLTLEQEATLNIVGSGAPWTQRSAIVYGVFDEQNERVQWRLRHQFPTLRNEDAQALGLRRTMTVQAQSHGTLDDEFAPLFAENPYGYAQLPRCPEAFAPLERAEISTDARAVFDEEPLPLEASPSAQVCADVELVDGGGAFVATALARKNPEVSAAFSALETPVRVVKQLKLMLQTCEEIVSERHRQMQMQRLFLSETDVLCIDDFATPDFGDRLAANLQARVDRERVDGDDMVFVIGLQRADAADDAAAALEQALARLAVVEGDKSSPRLVGAFVFDSEGHGVSTPGLGRFVLWCPSTFGGDDLDSIDEVSLRDCAVQQNQDLVLGPIRTTSLPILPTRRQFERFADRYSEDLAGDARSLTIRAPLRTPLSETVPIENFAVATFFNNEAITAEAPHAFSSCVSEDGRFVPAVVRLPDGTVVPIEFLPDVHNVLPQSRYPLGLAWDFPWYVLLEYDAYVAGAASVIIQVTVPFGPTIPSRQFLGGQQWQQQSFDLSTLLLQCRRHCDHPTFDSAGIYNVQSFFRTTFAHACYRPRFPRFGDGGFPRDP